MATHSSFLATDRGAWQATVHGVTNSWTQLSRLNSNSSNIPLYMYCILFTHSSADGHLGCFHVLTIVNRAAVNTGEHVSS